MRKIEKDILDFIKEDYDYFKREKRFSVRDYVFKEKNGDFHYYLWNSNIFYKKEGKVYFDFCQYTTNTTKSRLNALWKSFFYEGGFFQRNWSIYLDFNDKIIEIDTSKKYCIDLATHELELIEGFKE